MRHSLRSVVCSSLLVSVRRAAPQVCWPRVRWRRQPPRRSPARECNSGMTSATTTCSQLHAVRGLSHKLDSESDRLTVVDIGPTAEGRSEYTAIITSAANQRRLAQLKDMNRRLALADGVTADEARRLARDGKVVVWIDGGLHATEVLGAQQTIETIYQLTQPDRSETTAGF